MKLIETIKKIIARRKEREAIMSKFTIDEEGRISLDADLIVNGNVYSKPTKTMTEQTKNEDIALRLRCYELAQKDIPLAMEYYKFVKKSASIDDYDLRLRCLDIERGRKIEEVEILFAFLTQDILDA